eukprot:TRINITY_DN7815_c0_g1_i2.p2 TRINITY_DN7815_c0_g1~~TRINITY_DN7815_c0_g1_i2.p2  ORF type:complete len:102 (+),score=9.33 TRINITY_DN7815_c0_g1_i2:141-446(+)
MSMTSVGSIIPQPEKENPPKRDDYDDKSKNYPHGSSNSSRYRDGERKDYYSGSRGGSRDRNDYHRRGDTSRYSRSKNNYNSRDGDRRDSSSYHSSRRNYKS